MTRPRPRLRRTPARAAFAVALLGAALPLSGCDYLGLESASTKAAAREAEGRAVGSACRHAGRALEDCYAYNPAAPKAAVFSGWKSMNDYMAENKLDTIKPSVEPKLPQPKRKAPAANAAAADEAAQAPPGAPAQASAPMSAPMAGAPIAGAKTAQPRKIDLPLDGAKAAAAN